MTAEPVFAHRVSGRPVRVVVAGAGAMGLAWARAVRLDPRLQLVAVVDTDVRRAKGLAIRLRLPDLVIAASLDTLPGVSADACVNATPPAAHHDVILAALRGGLSVLCEKPFTGDLGQAIQLTREARSLGRLLMVSQSRRYQPGVAALKSALDGTGGVRTLRTQFGRDYPAAGFRARLAQPLLTDMAVHAFDTARYLTEAQAVSVRCETVHRLESGYAGPAQATALFEMSDGSTFHYTGSWYAPEQPTPWGGRWQAVGPSGSAEWDGAGRISSERTLQDGHGPGPEAGTVTVDDAAFDEDPVRQVAGPLDEFVEALATGGKPWGEAADNLGTVAMVHHAIASARRGTEVGFEEFTQALGESVGTV